MPRKPTDLKLTSLAVVPKAGAKSPLQAIIDEWLDWLRIDGARPATIKDHANKIDKFRWFWEEYKVQGATYAHKLGAGVDSVSVKEARAFLAYLRTPTIERWGIRSLENPSKDVLSPESVKSYGRSIKAFFNWCKKDEQGYIDRSPFEDVTFSRKHEVNRALKTISPEDQQKIFAYLNHPLRIDTFTGKRNLAMIALLADSGIRSGELLSIKIAGLDLTKRRVAITGKTGSAVALFGEKCRAALSNYLQDEFMQGRAQNSPLWVNDDGLPLLQAGLAHVTRTIKKATGVDCNPHRWRHTFGTTLAAEGVNIYEISRLLHHENITTTQKYVHDNLDRQQEIHRQHSPLDRQGAVEIKRRGKKKG